MARIKRVLFVLDMFGFFGGPERRAYRIAKGLKRLGYEIVIISIMKAEDGVIKRAKEDGIESYQLTSEGNKALKSFRVDVFLKLRKLINHIAPDVVFTFEFLADYTTKMALTGKSTPVYTFIGSTVWKWEKKWHRRVVMEHFTKKSRLYVVNSNTVRDSVLRVLPMVKDKIAVVYNPIDTDYFKPLSEKERYRTKKEYNLKEDDFVVGSVVRFYNPKGADVLVEAFYKGNIEGRLVLVGDGPFKGKLEQMVRDFGIEGRVVFLGAIEATPEIYNMFDVCVVPSQKGGFDNVVVEAMACGIPTVATKATGIGEVAENGRDLIITEIDAESVSEGMRRIMPVGDTIGINGRKFVVDRLDVMKISKRIEGLINATC
ncbi:glycosyltransferase [Hippea maritima]|uniref:Glycosyl transferase group 1 n=1 Tax=Hippea maritima (strain ATCC 700847 / DSM 10411 / MH2) TaxID=760142 RepID=F2LW45_HIPMA|nr:glycosyltransferase [Hippea maritima]AEA33979.1 glycosyl transferase group 1 [Hippea maritima DSM 10411]